MKQLNVINRLELSDRELKDLKLALASDKLIIATLGKIINLRRAQAKATKADYDNPNWPYRRAYKDGQLDELDFIYNLFEMDEKE